MGLSKRKDKARKKYVPADPESDPSLSDSSSGKSDSSDYIKYISKIRDKIKSFGSAQNNTRQNHNQTTMIFPNKVFIKARDVIKIRTTRKRNRTLSNYAQN